MDINERAGELAGSFGRTIRTGRKALGLRQAQLALAAGVSREFLIDLERGKATAELGRALLVARAVGMTLDVASPPPAAPEGADGLPEPDDEEEADDVQAPRIF